MKSHRLVVFLVFLFTLVLSAGCETKSSDVPDKGATEMGDTNDAGAKEDAKGEVKADAGAKEDAKEAVKADAGK